MFFNGQKLENAIKRDENELRQKLKKHSETFFLTTFVWWKKYTKKLIPQSKDDIHSQMAVKVSFSARAFIFSTAINSLLFNYLLIFFCLHLRGEEKKLVSTAKEIYRSEFYANLNSMRKVMRNSLLASRWRHLCFPTITQSVLAFLKISVPPKLEFCHCPKNLFCFKFPLFPQIFPLCLKFPLFL